MLCRRFSCIAAFFKNKQTRFIFDFRKRLRQLAMTCTVAVISFCLSRGEWLANLGVPQ